MNIEFEIKDNQVKVIQDKGYKLMPLNPNIKEILICENNIEEMKDLIEKENDKIKISKKNIRNKGYYHLSIGLLWLTSTTLYLLQNKILVGSVFGLNAFLQTVHGICYILPEKRYIKIHKEKIGIIKKNIEEETKKLEELNNSKEALTNNLPDYKLEPSEEIKILKRKLDAFHNFKLNKKEYIKAYEKNELKYYPVEDINLIEEIIKDYLEANPKEKQKKLKQ